MISVQRVASRRDAQNERDGAGLRSSVAAATPSQQRLRRSSVAAALRAPWAVDGALGGAAPRENLPTFGQKQGYTHHHTTLWVRIILPKELRPLPCSGFFLGGYFVIKKSCVWV